MEAFDARRAVVLAIGEGEASRVLRTEDGGATWTESFRNTDPRAFYDCMTFFDRRHGLAMSDPVDGKYRILSTRDGGRSWKVLPNAGMPDALPGEAGFAASGQCLVSAGPRDVWLATGGGATARVLHSADRGLTWTATVSPIPAGDPARGVFGLAFRDRAHGIAVGGDYRKDQPSPQAGAVTGDGGRTWRASATPPAGVPLRRRLAAAQQERRARRRPDGHGSDHRRRPHLAHGRHRLVRHGGLHARRLLLGLGREGQDRPARPVVRRGAAPGTRRVRRPSWSRRTP